MAVFAESCVSAKIYVVFLAEGEISRRPRRPAENSSCIAESEWNFPL